MNTPKIHRLAIALVLIGSFSVVIADEKSAAPAAIDGVKGVKQDNKTAAGQVQVLVSKANIPAGTALDSSRSIAFIRRGSKGWPSQRISCTLKSPSV